MMMSVAVIVCIDGEYARVPTVRQNRALGARPPVRPIDRRTMLPMTRMNRRITLSQRPSGTPDDTTFGTDLVEVPALGDDEALVEVTWLSIDPTIRGWMAYDTYLPAIEIGAPIRSGGLARAWVRSVVMRASGSYLWYDPPPVRTPFRCFAEH